ncbi:hypothetical protein L1987_65428 [Smallanthus sonchifolius]|uniref:Uncharacterized protein n=1 Tax=Smallanthus sonchifolius TaxID=185202 RepID=A0ACB9BUI6_9ASTR|nr:hypothetical protein L1987_65428 [Smallanthus sonchifolius]
MDVELHDWEVLDDSTSVHNTAYLEDIERDFEGTIRSDYFSLEYSTTHVQDAIDQASVESDNPSWIDPVSDTNCSKTKPIGELWSTDGSDDAESELGIVENAARNDEESLSDLGEIESKPNVSEKIDGEEKTVEARRNERVAVVWWKLPLDLLKYCLFKASPVWTLSVAAAMMGVVILGRRLYKMKQKTRSLQLKLTIDDDKKVSQVMSRAARLNEAFSVVKRAPMIRPSLPATGIAPWPVMALR